MNNLWFRRIVPQGYVSGTLSLEGTSRLLMSCPDLDRESDLFLSYDALSHKPRRTSAEDAALRRLEWEVRIYHDAEIGPFIPGKNLKAMLVAAAGAFRKGATLNRSLVFVESRVPLKYEGPRDLDGLWAKGFRYTTMVRNAGINGGGVPRCRPSFAPPWSLTVELAFDPEEIDSHTLELIVARSERYGLGDWRPERGGEFGTFVSRLTLAAAKGKARKAQGSKPRVAHEEEAHAAFRDRIIVPGDDHNPHYETLKVGKPIAVSDL